MEDPINYINHWRKNGISEDKILELLKNMEYSDEDIYTLMREAEKPKKKILHSIPKIYLILIIAILLVGLYYGYYYYKYDYIVAADGEKYYLDTKKTYTLIEDNKAYEIELPMSQKLLRKYEKLKGEILQNVIDSRYNEGLFWISFYNTTNENLFIDSFIAQIDGLIEGGSLKYNGPDARAYYATKLIQGMQYDHLLSYRRTWKTRLPYETLYEKKGVCRETSLLLAKIFSRQGYGAAIISIKKANHAVVGIKCNSPLAVKGYCVVESTGERTIGASQYKGGFWGLEEINPNIHFVFYEMSEGNTFDFSYE